MIQVRTTGKDSEKGPWQIAVAEADEARARDFVGKVIQGEMELPSLPSKLSPLSTWALVVISALALALFAVSLMGC